MNLNSRKLHEMIELVWPVETWCDYSVLVAVSGGADSVALLRVLHELRLKNPGKGRLIVGHVDHGLRQEESTNDAAFVEGLCEELSVQCLSVRLEVDGIDTMASRSGRGLEDILRQQRYDAFVAMANECGARFVATGHNRDDQVETVLFRLLRGTGIGGLAGIPLNRSIAENLTVVRPLLNTPRVDLERYLKQVGSSWRHDSTNLSSEFTRNRLRHEAFPMLEKIFGNDIRKSICAVSSASRELSQYLKRAVRPIVESCFEVQANRIRIDCVKAESFDSYLVIEAIREAWNEAGFDTKDMTSRKWKRLGELSRSAMECVENFPGNLRVERTVQPPCLSITPQNAD